MFLPADKVISPWGYSRGWLVSNSFLQPQTSSLKITRVNENRSHVVAAVGSRVNGLLNLDASFLFSVVHARARACVCVRVCVLVVDWVALFVGWLVCCLFEFYDISTFVGYITPNPFLEK